MSCVTILDLYILFIQDARIPIDMVGGTSIGALIGALLCTETETAGVKDKTIKWFKVGSFYCYFCVMSNSLI
jgi:predicted acylesterase/phospholipase RssA